MEISDKKIYILRVLFVIGLIVGFITLIGTLIPFLTYPGFPIDLDDWILNNLIGFLFFLFIFWIYPILLICISIAGLLLTK